MPALLSDLWIFFSEVFGNWQAYATGGGVMAVLQIWERLSGKTISRRAYIYLVIVAFALVACFQAWKDKQVETVNLKTNIATLNSQIATLNADLDTLRKPVLVGHIDQISSSLNVSQGTQILIQMTITNTGAPSVVNGYRLVIQRGSLTIPVQPTAIPNPWELTEGGKIIAKFTRNDTLYEKTAKPIERGNWVIGWLLFWTRDIDHHELRKPGTKLTVIFQDIFGNTYQSSYEMMGNPGKIRYFPGTNPFVVPSEQPKQKRAPKPSLGGYDKIDKDKN